MTKLSPSKTTFELYSLMEGQVIRCPSKILCVGSLSYQPMGPAQVISFHSLFEYQAALNAPSVRSDGKRT